MPGWKWAWSSRQSWCWRWWQLCKPTLFCRPSPQTRPQVTSPCGPQTKENTRLKSNFVIPVKLEADACVSSLGSSQSGLKRHRRLLTEGSSRGRLPTRQQPAAPAILHPNAERLLQQALLDAAGPPCAGKGHAALEGHIQDDARSANILWSQIWKDELNRCASPSLSLSLSQLESLLQLWLTLSLNTCTGASEESGSDIFLFNASRVPTIPLNQGLFILCFSSDSFKQQNYFCAIFWWIIFKWPSISLLRSASISSFLTVLAWYPNTSLRTWCLVLHSLALMTNMPPAGQSLLQTIALI